MASQLGLSRDQYLSWCICSSGSLIDCGQQHCHVDAIQSLILMDLFYGPQLCPICDFGRSGPEDRMSEDVKVLSSICRWARTVYYACSQWRVGRQHLVDDFFTHESQRELFQQVLVALVTCASEGQVHGLDLPSLPKSFVEY